MLRKLLVFALILTFAPLCAAQERILAFHADIRIQADGSMLVTETIRVQVAGDQIKRGIYRDFPTTYRDKQGHRYSVQFDLIRAQRDGIDEPAAQERLSNGVRIRLGRADFFLPRGMTTYEIQYKTDRQLGFFPEHDELYWNVTGNGWAFRIDKASAVVRLPHSPPSNTLAIEGYTGPAGSSGRDYSARIDDDGSAWIEANQPLPPGEGLTLVFIFPKGLIVEPDATKKTQAFLLDNRGILIALLSFIVLWAWYLFNWWHHGRDPAKGAIFAQYQAPDGLSPAALRYVWTMSHDMQCISSDLLHAAVDGHITIEHRASGYLINRISDVSENTSSSTLVDALISRKGRFFDLSTNESHSELRAAITEHGLWLKKHVQKPNFVTNTWCTVLGVIGSVLALFAALLVELGSEQLVLAAIAAIALALIAGFGAASIESARANPGPGRILKFVVGGALLVLAAILCGLFASIDFISLGFALLIFMLGVTHALFSQWLPRYTERGRRLMDKVEGFRLYLSLAEREDIARVQGPQMNGEIYARFLPYASALNVEKAWTGKLIAALGATAAAAAIQQSSVGWYHDSSGSAFTPGAFASDLSAGISSAISSASTPPGSSSGGGGGGSSGGGGGGGGGGGW